jgi:hypothetical protein
VIASPGDAEEFALRGGRAALDRLQRTSQPPRLIATPTGDHSAYHPAIWAAIRDTVLPVVAAPLPEHIPGPDIVSSPNLLATNRNHFPNGSVPVVVSTGYTVCSERVHHYSGGRP